MQVELGSLLVAVSYLSGVADVYAAEEITGWRWNSRLLPWRSSSTLLMVTHPGAVEYTQVTAAAGYGEATSPYWQIRASADYVISLRRVSLAVRLVEPVAIIANTVFASHNN